RTLNLSLVNKYLGEETASSAAATLSHEGVVFSETSSSASGVEFGEQSTSSEVGVQPARSARVIPLAINGNTQERRATGTSGILYSGIPFFRWMGKLKGLFGKTKKQPTAAPYEEPGLHDRTNRPIFMNTEDTSDMEEPGAVLSGVDQPEQVLVGEGGFKLTVEDEDKVEHTFPNIELEVSSTVKNFSPEYNRLVLDSDHVFELRNLSLEPQRPDHFYFVLSNDNGEFGKLLDGLGQLGLTRQVRIKIQKSSQVRSYVLLPVIGAGVEKGVVLADVDKALLKGIKHPEKGVIVYEDGVLNYQNEQGEKTPLQDSFIRLPKGESRYWIAALAMHPETHFKLGVFSTKDKRPLLALLSVNHVGLKNTGPILKEISDLSEGTANAITLIIGNVLPGFMGFMRPFLRRYGETKVLRFASVVLTAGFVASVASGFYGHLPFLDFKRLLLFLSSLTCISLGYSAVRLVQSLATEANHGMVLKKPSKGKPVAVSTARANQVTYDSSHLLQRSKEVFKSFFKKTKKAASNANWFQRSFIVKGIGSLLFYCLPSIINRISGLVTEDVNELDFSFSYLPFSLMSLFLLYKIFRTNLKDVTPPDLFSLETELGKAQEAQAKAIAQDLPLALTLNSPLIAKAVGQLKSKIDNLAFAQARKTKGSAKKLALVAEQQSIEAITSYLAAKEVDAEKVQKIGKALQDQFDKVGHRNVNLWKVANMKGVKGALAAMALATFGEFGLSVDVSFTINEIVGNGADAIALAAIISYGCTILWRLWHNVLDTRLSSGSAYLISSLSGIIGSYLFALSLASHNFPAMLASAALAVYGTCTFFAQMLSHIYGLHEEYKRELQIWVQWTMPLSAILAIPMRWSAIKDIPGLGGFLVGTAMLASVLLTRKMLANSSIVLTAQHYLNMLKARLHQMFDTGEKLPASEPLENTQELDPTPMGQEPPDPVPAEDQTPTDAPAY
ncbi:MAG: hypothetical protein J6X06_07090, partial [Elusimicrobiaceae bacterium]|nr:hypothetical protein [Elusimicrobiaceae bacterium]